MAKKMLGKVVAGAALGGASLLVFTPGMAFASGHHHDGEDKGKVHAEPDAVHAGHKVKLIEVCEKPQEFPFVWSEATGKVKLSPVRDGAGEEAGREDPDQRGKDGKDRHGRDEKGRDGKDEHGRDDGKGPDGKAEYPKPPADGLGGGMSDTPADDASTAAEGRDPKGHEEHGQEEESEGRDWKGDDGKDRWEHKKDFVYYGEATVAAGTTPGTYKLTGSCGEGKLTVLPTGGVDGGDGGMTTDRGLAAAGASLLGAAALGGIVLMRRRRADGLV